MAAARRAKGTAGRKVKDKWKAKEWYNVHAPKMFNEMVIGETPAADPALLIGRTAEVTVQDLTGDFAKMHIKLKFKITGTDGHEAKTTFIGHDLTSDYVRRLTRRKKTKTDHVVDVVTFDHYHVRIKTMSIAERRIQSSQEEGMRQIIGVTLVQMAEKMTLSDIVKNVISGELAKDISKACRVVIPIKRLEIRKTEVVKVGDGEPESIIEEKPAPAPPEAAGSEEEFLDAAEEGPAEDSAEEASPEEESSVESAEEPSEEEPSGEEAAEGGEVEETPAEEPSEEEPSEDDAVSEEAEENPSQE
ncbi:MAG: 30S ribosomal protein S3ae [Methanomassiliicoccaceae archaeon]|nr:30S ribosomal protein S3ae [Methanomassiliicoccaceae archaeon]